MNAQLFRRKLESRQHDFNMRDVQLDELRAFVAEDDSQAMEYRAAVRDADYLAQEEGLWAS